MLPVELFVRLQSCTFKWETAQILPIPFEAVSQADDTCTSNEQPIPSCASQLSILPGVSKSQLPARRGPHRGPHRRFPLALLRVPKSVCAASQLIFSEL